MHFLEGLTIRDPGRKKKGMTENPGLLWKVKHRCQRRGCGRVALSEFAFMFFGVANCFPHPSTSAAKLPGSLEIARLLIFKRNTVHFHMG